MSIVLEVDSYRVRTLHCIVLEHRLNSDYILYISYVNIISITLQVDSYRVRTLHCMVLEHSLKRV